jgi:dihydrofolate reductase
VVAVYSLQFSKKKKKMKMPRLSLILAETRGAHGLGYKNELPWSLPEEFRYFVSKTKECPDAMQNAVIYGRRTWDSMQQRPMRGRVNILLSRHPEETRVSCKVPENVAVLPSLDHALHYLSSPDIAPKLHKVFILGGTALYEESMRHAQGFIILFL